MNHRQMPSRLVAVKPSCMSSNAMRWLSRAKASQHMFVARKAIQPKREYRLLVAKRKAPSRPSAAPNHSSMCVFQRDDERRMVFGVRLSRVVDRNAGLRMQHRRGTYCSISRSQRAGPSLCVARPALPSFRLNWSVTGILVPGMPAFKTHHFIRHVCGKPSKADGEVITNSLQFRLQPKSTQDAPHNVRGRRRSPVAC